MFNVSGASNAQLSPPVILGEYPIAVLCRHNLGGESKELTFRFRFFDYIHFVHYAHNYRASLDTGY